MFGSASLSQSRPRDADAPDHRSCEVMVLSLDSLGQCVSALSKRFAAEEAVTDPVSCTPHSHGGEKDPEVRHRKDTQHQQEDAPTPKVASTATSSPATPLWT